MKSDAAYAYAWEHSERNHDGSVIEKSLVGLLAAAIDFDEAKERLGHARRVGSGRHLRVVVADGPGRRVRRRHVPGVGDLRPA